MVILLSLAQVAVFLRLFYKSLKKRPGIFYGIAVALVLWISVDGLMGISLGWPSWVRVYILSPQWRGGFATALFMVVMYIGALNPRIPLVRTLMGIRAEMSIVASILTFGHVLRYGYGYFPMLIQSPQEMAPAYVAATVITMLLVLLLVPLFITSFPSVRKRMSALRWKRLQKLAYPFYFLLYLHVALLFVDGLIQYGHGNYIVGLAVYTLIYGSYAALRPRRGRTA
jgi:DMSO/TMAO reductase YedYZ heme-binding membrane subunit